MVHFWFYFAAQFLFYFDFHLKLALKKIPYLCIFINQSFGVQDCDIKHMCKIEDVIFNSNSKKRSGKLLCCVNSLYKASFFLLAHF